MGTKINPGPFDCYAAAEPDEPMFILLARDPEAAALVRAWAQRRSEQPRPNPAKISEAYKLADEMDAWREENCPPVTVKL